jgi:hypothetical protein
VHALHVKFVFTYLSHPLSFMLSQICYINCFEKLNYNSIIVFYYISFKGEFEMKDSSDNSDSEDEESGFNSTLDLCLPALQYLRQCCETIATMHRMPNCPIFNGADR